MRFTLQRSPRSNSATSFALSGKSFTPPSSTYSKVIHSLVRKGKFFAAAISISRFHFLFSGISRVRSASFEAFSEIASFGRIDSAPKS